MADVRRILLVEDSQYDAELIVAALAESGLGHEVEIVTRWRCGPGISPAPSEV